MTNQHYIQIYNILREISHPLILEIGANDGEDTKILRSMCPESTIHCFEPDPYNIELLKKKGIDSFASIHEHALSDQDGEFDFYLSQAQNSNGTLHLGTSSSLLKPKTHLDVFPHVKFNKSIKVKTKKLATFAKENNIGTIDFVWIDVQGAEKKVIDGCEEFANNIRYISTDIYDASELYEGMCNSSQFLEALGEHWKVAWRDGADFIFKNTKLVA
jgi:FkbM family methyltransferase